MSIPDILLVVCVLILVWRVWRLEGFVATVQKAVDQMQRSAISDALRDGDMRMLSEAARDIGMGAHKRLETLASALGYEWKSTPAKSGWERKASPFGFKPLMSEAREEAIRSIEHAINTTPNPFCSARIRYYESGDRRKADRRKPAPQAAPKSPPKKRRAH